MLRLLIVTPTLNAAHYLPQCIKSVNKLSHHHVTVTHVIADSGSTDATLQIAASFGLRTVYCPPGNMYAAINKAISLCPSDWITYINSDDLLHHDCLSYLHFADCLHTADIVTGSFRIFSDDNQFVGYTRYPLPRAFHQILYSSGIMPFPQSGTFFRRSLYEKLNGFSEDLKYASDFDFFLRAYKASASYYSSYKLFSSFRLHSSQLSRVHDASLRSEVRSSISRFTGSHHLVFQIFLSMFARFLYFSYCSNVFAPIYNRLR